MDMDRLLQTIESGKQVGIEKFYKVGDAEFLYVYAVQKLASGYIVYTNNVNLDCCFDSDNENVRIYDSIADLLSEFRGEHGIAFEDLHKSKGQKFFNEKLYAE